MKNNNSLDCISVSNIQCYAQIGVDDTERAIGQKLIIDAEIYLDLVTPGESAELADTVSYVELSKKIIETTQKRDYKLIESLAHILCKEIFASFNKVHEIKMIVEKPHIPAPEFHGEAQVCICRKREI